MKDLIKITTNDKGKQLVSARELYEFLEATERFSSWFERYCKYGFEENIDYQDFYYHDGIYVYFEGDNLEFTNAGLIIRQKTKLFFIKQLRLLVKVNYI